MTFEWHVNEVKGWGWGGGGLLWQLCNCFLVPIASEIYVMLFQGTIQSHKLAAVAQELESSTNQLLQSAW